MLQISGGGYQIVEMQKPLNLQRCNFPAMKGAKNKPRFNHVLHTT